MAGMNGHLITIEDGSAQEPSLANIERLLSSSTLFWLDLADLGHDEAESLLGGTFGFHPLAVEDADHFGQRPNRRSRHVVPGPRLADRRRHGAAGRAWQKTHAFASQEVAHHQSAGHAHLAVDVLACGSP